MPPYDPYQRLLILPFRERAVARERIRRGQSIFGGVSLASTSSSDDGWTAKEPPKTETDVDAALRLLGLKHGASEAEIRAAFKTKAFEAHPDRGGDEVLFKKLNAARSLLLKATGAA